jgi:hypothetical protein
MDLDQESNKAINNTFASKMVPTYLLQLESLGYVHEARKHKNDIVTSYSETRINQSIEEKC